MDCIKDLQDAIRNILVNNGLTELCLNLESTMDVCTSQQEMITLNSQLLLSMRKILYNRRCV